MSRYKTHLSKSLFNYKYICNIQKSSAATSCACTRSVSATAHKHQREHHHHTTVLPGCSPGDGVKTTSVTNTQPSRVKVKDQTNRMNAAFTVGIRGSSALSVLIPSHSEALICTLHILQSTSWSDSSVSEKLDYWQKFTSVSSENRNDIWVFHSRNDMLLSHLSHNDATCCLTACRAFNSQRRYLLPRRSSMICCH